MPENIQIGTASAPRLRPAVQIMLLWCGSMGGAALAFLAQIVLARAMSPSDYGEFAGLMAMTSILSSLAGFGLQGFWLKAFGQEGWAAQRWLPASIRLFILSSCATVCVYLAWQALGPATHTSWVAIWLMAPTICALASVELVTARYQLEERFALIAAWQIVPQFLRVVLCLAILFAISRARLAAAAAVHFSIALSVIVFAIVSLRQIQGVAFRLKAHGDRPVRQHSRVPSMRKVFSESWVFGLSSIFYLIYFQSDIILLGYLRGSIEAGAYNIAATVMSGVYLLPIAMYQKFLLSKIHRWAVYDKAKLAKSVRFGAVGMFWAGLVAVLALWLFGPWLLRLLFGQKYIGSVVLIKILSLCVPIRFLSTAISSVLTSGENMKRRVAMMAAAAAANIALNIVLVPLYGAMGSAWATVFTEILLLLMFSVSVAKRRQEIFH